MMSGLSGSGLNTKIAERLVESIEEEEARTEIRTEVRTEIRTEHVGNGTAEGHRGLSSPGSMDRASAHRMTAPAAFHYDEESDLKKRSDLDNEDLNSGMALAHLDEDPFDSNVTRRQAEWDRKLESVDQKQAELGSMQWRLVREQTGSLARELAAVQQQLKDLKADSRRALQEVDRFFRENESRLNEERGLRLAMFESLEQRNKKAKHDLEAEVRARTNGDAEILPKLQELKDVVEQRSREQQALAEEQRRMREVFTSSMQELDALKDAINQEANERKNGEESMLLGLKELREALSKEMRDRAAGEQELSSVCRGMVEQEKADRNLGHSNLRNTINAFNKDISPLRDDVPALRAKIQDCETAFRTRLEELRRTADRDLGDRSAAIQKVERSIVELKNGLEKEGICRTALAEETDQILKSVKNKVKAQLHEAMESARIGREELHHTLSEVIEKETVAREGQNEVLTTQISGNKVAFDVRLDAMDASCREIEQRYREDMVAKEREWETQHLKLSEELFKQLRECRDSFQARIGEERTARETGDAAIEEHLDFLDRFLQDVRELFLQKGSRQRQMVTRKTVPVSPQTSSAHRSISTGATSRV